MASDDTHEDDDGPMLSKSMSKYFASSEFSDMKIKCGDTVHAVHRAIVCGQSSFFANAMKQEHGFKEAQTNTVELNHDHPATIKAMLEYMYLEKYSDVTLGDKLEERVSLHIDVYSVADKYGVGGLRKYASGNIKDLVDLENISPDTLAQIIGNAYEKTSENDKYLRPLIAEIVSDGIDGIIRDTQLLAMVESVQGFHSELVKAVANERHRPKRYACVSCGWKVHLVLADTERGDDPNVWGPSAYDKMHCPICGERHANSTWKKNILSS
ncbi:hypothetical protein DIS24_g11930 [Lasiodiplodia hormozganensis]|uniref:BTB domain-containing protein n=1 Tax=Lasiodiplodia hormozganensis TaxID=869390 RepID=A0AA40BV30_9PEZI|nr:hypothetical protein DIS24_g11930 [Lasiodiplodia hormozganensis]